MNLKKLGILFLFSVSTWANKPVWVNSPGKYCKKSQICAVGSGTGRLMARSAAVAAMAKVFDNKVKADFSTVLSNSSGKDYEEAIKEEIREITETALTGVEVTEYHEDQNGVFALAVINKRKAAIGIKKELSKIDEKLRVLFEDGSPASTAQLPAMWIKREQLNKRHIFLVGRSVDAPVSYEQIFKSQKKNTKDIVVFMEIDEGDRSDLSTHVNKELSKVGYKITQSQFSQFTHRLTGQFVEEKMYMKVKGWVKYKFALRLFSVDNSGKQNGSLNAEVETTGRSKDQAYHKALAKLKQQVSTKISGLTFNPPSKEVL